MSVHRKKILCNQLPLYDRKGRGEYELITPFKSIIVVI